MVRLVGIRHGHSMANAYMDERPWGSPNFVDDTPVDARLSPRGRQEVEVLENDNNMPSVDVWVLSPLSRCLETFRYGKLLSVAANKKCAIVIQPLLSERVYTQSDTGRSPKELQEEFPEFDFSGLEEQWWYVGESNGNEWRPADEGQTYGVPGEPFEAFESRMEALKQWLRQEFAGKTVGLVTHWGVLKYLMNQEAENAQVVQGELS